MSIIVNGAYSPKGYQGDIDMSVSISNSSSDQIQRKASTQAKLARQRRETE